MLITEFFEDQEVFITGGSGFIGKALIEKLLRSCTGIRKIFVLLRCKKGKSTETRLRELLKSSVFNRLRQEQPEILNKLHAIKGDCAELGLGISDADLVNIQNVSIVFHSAASVRFDDGLRDAILLNTRGTFELIKLAQSLKNLKVLVHVSTTYCNPDKHIVEEKVYPAYADWRTTIKLAETYNTETLNIFNLKYGNNQPNTYTFTKSLAEQIINDYRDQLPMFIFRPSIVVSSLEEPMPGWLDNFNGPIGMLIACGIGIMRTNYGDPDTVSDFVPVDVVVRAMLVATYKKGIEGYNPHQNTDLEVFNCATATICSLTMGEVIETGKKIIKQNPMEKTLWVPGGSITRCYVWNLIRFITLHLLMAILMDSALRLINGKPFLLKLQRRIYAANVALYYFMTTTWIFKNDKFFALNSLVPESESAIFSYVPETAVDYEEFFRKGIRGAKEFLLKESPESSRGARIRLKIFQVLHYLIEFMGLLLISRYLYAKFF